MCVCLCVCGVYVRMQAEQKESYLKDVKVPLKRFCDYLKDRKWVAGDLVGITVYVVACRSYGCSPVHFTVTPLAPHYLTVVVFLS